MKSRLIVNPVAGTDAAPDYLTTINERLREHVGAMDIVVTVEAGDASRAAAAAVADGYDHLFVGGGDGTFNEVINGVGASRGGFDRITFGLIPLGTGNDFATALDIPDDLEGALQVVVHGEPRRLDVGRLNDRFFINVSAGGFIADVSDAVDPKLKTVAGKLAYLIGGAQVLFTHEPFVAQISAADDSRRQIALTTFAVCNSRLIGGGRLIAPDASPSDGMLDVCLIRAMPTVEFLALLTRVTDGDHIGDERVTYFRTAELTLAFDRQVNVNTDGEVLEASTCHYRVVPGAIRMLTPPPNRNAATIDA